MSQVDSAEAPVRLGARVGIYLFLGTVKGILRDVFLFHWSLETIVHCRVVSMLAAVVTVWAYEAYAQHYLSAHKRQWNLRAVALTIGALVVMKAVPTFAIVWYEADKPSDLWIGGGLVVFTNTILWSCDRFEWLEKIRNRSKKAMINCVRALRRNR